MDEAEFERIAAEEWGQVPAHFRKQVDNVALIIEDEPSAETRVREGLTEHETLLGLYHGVPNTERGDMYGVGATLPDTITLYRLPLMEEARELSLDAQEAGKPERPFPEWVRRAVRETLWHELGHYFGLEEGEVRHREHDRSNRFE
jgi:predicted Zn-dependent protease with MMP-like domain